jgi:hypothetical protein
MVTRKRNISCTDKKRSIKLRKRRIKELAREAAARTLNGNGSSPNLPPLPRVNDDKGLGTLFSHPYGALPYGNIFMAVSDEVRENGLGNMRCLNDEQVLSVLQYLDAKTLSNTVVKASRFLYVAGHHEELWRDLTLRKLQSTGFDFVASWKDTFIRAELEAQGNLHLFREHRPIPMKGIFSDTFFRSWLCRSFELQDSWLAVNNVSVEDSKTLTLEQFLKYEEKNIPVIVRGATSSWPALKKWNEEYLSKETAGMTFRATSGVAPLPAQFTMDSYTNYCNSATEEAPLYLFDRTFAHKCPQLVQDFEPSLKENCPYFDNDASHGHDLFALLGEFIRPDYRWIIIGPKRSGSNFHIDPNATHAWNAPIKGRKRWIFYPPGVNPPGVYPSPSGDDVIMPISLGEWFLTHWNDHVKQRSNPDRSKRPLECTVNPGDILFVPHGWWHCVLNLDDGMNIALTKNYVSKSNLADVLRFLRMKPQQISGCRDREEAIKPEELHDTFVSRLKSKRPDLLQEAVKLSELGWQCAAWTDDVKKVAHGKIREKSNFSTFLSQQTKLREEEKGAVHCSSSDRFTFSFM